MKITGTTRMSKASAASCLWLAWLLLSIPACTQTSRSPVVFASVVENPSGVTVSWTFRNRMHVPVWIPVAWGMNEPRHELPLAYVVPPGHLVLCFGYFKGNIEGRGEIVEGQEMVRTLRVDPDGSFQGKITLKSPYRVPPELEDHRLGNPFRLDTRISILHGKEMVIRRIGRVQVAVEYWLFDVSKRVFPSPRRAGANFHRTARVEALITGDKSGSTYMGSARSLALSPSLPVRLPLHSAQKIFCYEGEDDDSRLVNNVFGCPPE